MKLNPQQAPLYGDCIITVLLTEDDKVGNDDVAFYLVFTGSAVQHFASTRKLDSSTLETIAPGHDCCETVKVSLCAAKHGHPILVVAEDSLQFVQDEAYDAAQFLATCAGNQQALNFTRFLDRSRPPAGDVDFLDEKVALAFRHLKLPPGWNVLGADHTLDDNVPRETLMHFAARLGLLRLTWFLLQQPGGRGALCIPNSEGATPVTLALERGYQKLHQLLTAEGASEPDSWSTLSHIVHSGEYCVKYHQRLDIYTLTVEREKGRGSSMDDEIIRLQTHMQNHEHTNARVCSQPAQRMPCEGMENESSAAAPDCNLRDMKAEEDQQGSSALLGFDAVQRLALACPEEAGCRQPAELVEAPKHELRLEDAENPASSGRSPNIAASLQKEEEEESSFAAEAGVAVEENDGRLSPASGPLSPVGLPAGGNINQEASGMTALNIALEQGSLGEESNHQQEVQAAEEGAPPGATRCPTSREESNGAMGQGECKSCTSPADPVPAAKLCVENSRRNLDPPGDTAVVGCPSTGAALEGLAATFLGEGSGQVTDQPEDASVATNPDVSPVTSRDSKPARSQMPSDLVTGVSSATFSPATESAGLNAGGMSDSLPNEEPVGEGTEKGQQSKTADSGVNGLGLSDGVQDTPPDICVENNGSSLEPESPGAGVKITELVAKGHDEQSFSEPLLSGTETTNDERSGSAGPASFEPETVASSAQQQGGNASEESNGSTVLDASELCPCFPGPSALHLAKADPLCKLAETAKNNGELDRFSRSAQDFLAVASALLVEEVIQQAQLIVAQEGNAGVTPVGQEASSHPESHALPLCSKGTERIQDNFTGTPSVIHNKESKQNQEVAAATEAAAAAAELTVAEQGSPLCSKQTAGTLSPADYWGETPEDKPSSLQPESGQELPGKEELLSEGLESVAVVQSPVCQRGEEFQASENNAEGGFQGEASSPAAAGHWKVDVTEDARQGSGPKEGASLHTCEASSADATLNHELELSSGLDASPKGVSDLMEDPPTASEPPMVAEHSQEGEEPESAPSRILLQPIAEEPPCDCDLGSEIAFSAGEAGTKPELESAQLSILGQPDQGTAEGSHNVPMPLLSPLSFCAGTELSEEAGETRSVQETDGVVVNNAEKTVEPPSQITLSEQLCGPMVSPVGNPVEIPSSGPEAQQAADIGFIPNGEEDLSLQPNGLMKSSELASPAPEPDTLEMKTEDEVDFMADPAEGASSEGTINRESWCPAEPPPDPPALESQRSCSTAESEIFLEDGLSSNCTSSQDIMKRDSGGESDLFPQSSNGMEEVDFGKQPEEEQSAGDSMSSTSSADDTFSLERNSSRGSDISLPRPLGLRRPKDRYSLDGSCSNMGPSVEGQDEEAAVSGDLEEELDSITEVPPPPSALRNSMRPLSPFRRHSWGPGKNNSSSETEINHRSYSLEGLAGEADGSIKPSSSLETASLNAKDLRQSPLANDERGSLVSLTEEEMELEHEEIRSFDRPICQRSQPRAFSFCATPVSPPLTKSMSLMTIAQGGPESNRSFSSTSTSLTQSICEESGNFLPPSPSRKDLEGKTVTKVSRTFSYLKNKMSSSKKSKEKEKDKEKEKVKEKDKDSKEKDKKTINGHIFSSTPTVGPVTCYHCLKPFNKDSFACSSCGAIVHKSCKENYIACARVKMKPQKGLQAHDTSSLPTVIMRSKSSQPKERPRSAILTPEEPSGTSLFSNRRSQQNPSLSKSVSIQNIAGVGIDDSLLHTFKFLSQSTDSLNKISRVNESMESLTDEGADMNEGQLMGDFETDSKQLEAQSWSQVVDGKFLRQQKKDVVKRQDVIYELMQTEMHHVRTLKIMSDVYSRCMVQELQYEQQMVDKVFPCLDDLLNIHTQFFQRILERKKESLADRSEKNFVIKRIGDILVNQFSGKNAERMKKTYGMFCGHHNEAVNYFKDLHAKDKRFQAFIKKKMSSSVVRRLGIPECILLVTQRITKYPVLLQRILQHTKENDNEHQDLVLSLNLVKEVITAVNSKVSNYEKKMRLNEIYTRTDSKSIMRMKGGQMFAREDLNRRKFVRDGSVSLKNAAGRLKEVQAILLSDVLIFLQEKDQKYVFASLDQKSTVISLKKLIVREVAHEEKGLFLISMGGKDPEMVEVHANSKEERNSWIQIIQDTINIMDKEEDEGVPSESEEEKRVLDIKARELKEQLQQKDQQIITLLEEKEKIFRDMTDCSGPDDSLGARTLFRANTEEAPKGESIMKSVMNEVELLQGLVSRSLGGTLGPQMSIPASEQEAVGPVSLPRRAETFGGFDSHQMNVCKGGEKDEGDDVQDLRRTESDSVLKKGTAANMMFVLKRNNEQVLQSITHLHSLLGTLQAIVVQQDTYIEDQKLMLTERALSRGSFRPNSLIEQEKQRSLEKQRQELANLQKQQAQHQEEKRKREREWEVREKDLAEREARLAQREEQIQKGQHSLEKEREELQQKKAAYQLDLEHLRTSQKQLEKEKEQLKRDIDHISQGQVESSSSLLSNQHTKMSRTPSLPPSEDQSSRQLSLFPPKQGHLDANLSVSPKRNSLSRTQKEKSTFHLLGPAASGQTNKPAEAQGQNRLFGLSKPKEKKEKKKKGKGNRSQPPESQSPEMAPESEEIFC